MCILHPEVINNTSVLLFRSVVAEGDGMLACVLRHRWYFVVVWHHVCLFVSFMALLITLIHRACRLLLPEAYHHLSYCVLLARHLIYNIQASQPGVGVNREMARHGAWHHNRLKRLVVNDVSPASIDR